METKLQDKVSYVEAACKDVAQLESAVLVLVSALEENGREVEVLKAKVELKDILQALFRI